MNSNMNVVGLEVFRRYHSARTQQRRKNEPRPANTTELIRRDFDDSLLDRKLELVAHELGRTIDEVCACKYRKIDGMRGQSDRFHDDDTPVSWLRRDAMRHADGRVPYAIYELEKLGYVEQSAELETGYKAWRKSWVSLQRSVPRRIPGKQTRSERAERVTLFDSLLCRAEALLGELEILVQRAANASELTLYLRPPPRAKLC
jgi:hypothetical protein